ncbi:hypothetical protein Mal64_11000 [Pseudobythopirellula maris]|uniref:Uncharacterized protein n=1 Tax=Pseudobythopirellula maris TaxID=2527991 RepID=A0A5C5ZUC2_9BACT|nr:hypothetical protein [Pseudobythopirellula maris]TWT90705.1 hypothetical protein Mal64_11000 [Pseudobythopirellula maris]
MRVYDDASSSSEAKQQALRAIPWRQLSASRRRGVEGIVREADLYRRLPSQVIDCDAEIFTHLAQNPELVVGVWRQMGVTQLNLQRRSDTTYHTSDGAGTKGGVRVLFADYGKGRGGEDDATGDVTILAYAEGVYDAPPMPQSIRARCVLLFRSTSFREENGRTYITGRLDSFVDFDDLAMEIVAKTLGPLINRTADHNFVETMKFMATFSRAATRNPDAIEGLAGRLDGIDPQPREELVRICRRAAQRENDWRTARVASVARRHEASDGGLRQPLTQ